MTLKWMLALLISSIAHMMVLFAIIVLVTFSNRDFDFSSTVMICVPYVSALIIYLIITSIIFKIKLD